MEHHREHNEQSASSPLYPAAVEGLAVPSPQASPAPHCLRQTFQAIDVPQRERCTDHQLLETVSDIALADIATKIVGSCSDEVSEGTHERLLNYIRLLASARKTDDQLVALGAAYLREILDPDRRYSGC